MPETPGRYGQLAPPINSYAVLYTVPASPARMIYGVDVCNGGSSLDVTPGTGTDAHISIWVVPEEDTWTPGTEPPLYTRVVYKQRVECDGVDGNVWASPVKHLDAEDRVVVYTDTINVTFYGHGFLYTA